MSQGKDIRERKSVGKKITHPDDLAMGQMLEKTTGAVPRRPLETSPTWRSRERLESVGKKIAHPTRSDESAVVQIVGFPKSPLGTSRIRGLAKQSSGESTEEPVQTLAKETFTAQQSLEESSSDTVATPGPSKKTGKFTPSKEEPGSYRMRMKSEKSDRTSAISQELRGSSSSINGGTVSYSSTERLVRVDLGEKLICYCGVPEKAYVEVVQDARQVQTVVQVNVIRSMSGTNLEGLCSEPKSVRQTVVALQKTRVDLVDMDKIETDPDHQRIKAIVLKPEAPVRPKAHKKIPNWCVNVCGFLRGDRRFSKCYFRSAALCLMSTFALALAFLVKLILYVVNRSGSENIARNGTMFPMATGGGRSF